MMVIRSIHLKFRMKVTANLPTLRNHLRSDVGVNFTLWNMILRHRIVNRPIPTCASFSDGIRKSFNKLYRASVSCIISIEDYPVCSRNWLSQYCRCLPGNRFSRIAIQSWNFNGTHQENERTMSGTVRWKYSQDTFRNWLIIWIKYKTFPSNNLIQSY